MKKYNRDYLKKLLTQVIRLDYNIELYRLDNQCIILSVYHLNSMYNALCKICCYKNQWTYPYIDWQYSRQNKKIEKLTSEIMFCVLALKNNENLLNDIFKEFNDRATNIYNSKYSLEL